MAVELPPAQMSRGGGSLALTTGAQDCRLPPGARNASGIPPKIFIMTMDLEGGGLWAPKSSQKTAPGLKAWPRIWLMRAGGTGVVALGNWRSITSPLHLRLFQVRTPVSTQSRMEESEERN